MTEIVDETLLEEPDTDDATVSEDEEVEATDFDQTSVSLFEGDEGGLEYAQRHALVTLLKQRFISSRTHRRDWAVLMDHERAIRSRLNELFLDLQIDRRREVAWKRQANSETGGRFPTMLHDTPWSREETLVLVHLRDRLRAGYNSGDTRVFIDRDDIGEYVASFRPAHATDEAGDERRATAAVASIVRSGLLIGAVGDDRFEISEAVEPLLPLELLQELFEALQKANSGEVPDEPDEELFDDGPIESEAVKAGEEQR